MPQKLVVIGAGMASGRFLEELFELAPDAYDVTLFGAEPRGNYNRIMLSPVLAGSKSFSDIVTHDADWYRQHGVTCRFGETVVKIDRKQKRVISAGGVTNFDKLVIATGSASFLIPVAGNDLPGVVGFRDLDDVEAMLKAAKKPEGKAVIIGGGLLGLEAAAALNDQGMKVTVLHLMGHLMERQLDPTAGQLLQKELQSRGINLVCNAHTNAILGTDHVEAVLMEDGTIHGADLVVMAAGIRPETRIAVDAGLHVERGIVVDDAMLTSDSDVFALGECVEHDSVVYGLVAPLFDMAKVLAQTLVGKDAGFVAPALSTKLKVTGVELFSVGDFADGDDREDIVFHDPGQGIYQRIVLQNDKIIGAVMYGDTSNSNWIFSKLKSAENIADIRETLIFGPAYETATESPVTPFDTPSISIDLGHQISGTAA
ncbi:MAG: FAD-dependent oxidoreductase [Rhodobacteraceae bacterium]|nr:FAD-dependent oxidoreductase [Paracoccaceae bacterium]